MSLPKKLKEQVSLGEFILIRPDEAPSRSDFESAVAILKKHAELIKKYSQRSDDPSPESLLSFSSFLESIVKKDGKRLK